MPAGAAILRRTGIEQRVTAPGCVGCNGRKIKLFVHPKSLDELGGAHGTERAETVQLAAVIGAFIAVQLYKIQTIIVYGIEYVLNFGIDKNARNFDAGQSRFILFQPFDHLFGGRISRRTGIQNEADEINRQRCNGEDVIGVSQPAYFDFHRVME